MTTTASTPPPNPLKAFTQLSPSVYIHCPANAPHKPEQIIILAFWMNAHPRTLTKYLTTYLDLYPRATILYTLSTSLDFLINFTARTQHARLQPAVTALRAAAAADATTSRDDPSRGPGSSHPRVYIHMFSNGGTFAVAHLLEAYRAATGRPLAVEAMLYDSAPGTSTFRGGMRALAVGLPANPVLRLLGMLVLAGIMGWSMLLTTVMPRADGVMVGRRGTVDAGLVVRGGSRTEGAEAAPRRCYLYSEGDRVVDARDVESHAEEVARQGWEVERVKFDGSAHVSHMRTDPDRYWGVVRRYFGGV